MRILLVGEYSRLHNSLKEGLLELGHEVTLVGNGDGFKNFPADLSYEPVWSKSKVGHILRQGIAKTTGFDLAKFEHGIRFRTMLRKLADFDVVQLINERPIQTTAQLELKLLKQLTRQNKTLFLLSCGFDYLGVKYLFENTHPKNILIPLRENPKLRPRFDYVLEYVTTAHKKIHDFIYSNCKGIIASDIDYVLPLHNNPKFRGLIPNPVNVAKLGYQLPTLSAKTVIFLGINEWNYHQKGINYFEKALAVIEQKYLQKVEIIITRNVPYPDYINSYNRCHILLDQVFAYDQGYNALEAMAKGKVVFTGAEKEFTDHYGLSARVAINAVPDVDMLVSELSALIENPDEILAISARARSFVETQHDHVRIAQRYLAVWATR
ncbi:MAG TPA: glycosyltransferase [Flavobacterium sp.]|jgi:glycosyltransferase involved in cell wall biosynthesis